MIRSLLPEDKPMVESWIAGEPTHASNTFDWYSEAGTKSVVFEDEAGSVLVAKFTPCLKIDIDFDPAAEPRRVARALTEGLADMGEQAKAQGFKQVSFDSVSDKLIAFCERLGFVKSPELRKVL
jgi:hypothetical protein